MSWKWFEVWISLDLGVIHDCCIFEYEYKTGHLHFFGSELRRDTAPGLQYFADDQEEAMLPVNPSTRSNGAPREGSMSHKLIIAVKI